VRHGTPVTTSVATPRRGAGPTCTSASSCGWYQCTPAGTSPTGSGSAAYTSSGKRPPAEPATRNRYVPNGRSPVRTTPADRCSKRDKADTSSPADATCALPASTATADAVVAGRSRGNATRGNGSA
jgi:hypothetical protein